MGLVRLGGVECGFGALVGLKECHCLVLVGLDVVYCWKNGFFFRSESWVGVMSLVGMPRILSAAFILRLVVGWFYK